LLIIKTRKLDPFIPNELEVEKLETTSSVSKSEKFEKNWNIESYANSQKFLKYFII